MSKLEGKDLNLLVLSTIYSKRAMSQSEHASHPAMSHHLLCKAVHPQTVGQTTFGSTPVWTKP